MVSMHTPRFFVEKDIVMLSALVRNRTGKDIRARVSISLKDGCLELIPADAPAVQGLSADTDNSAVREVDVPAQGGQSSTGGLPPSGREPPPSPWKHRLALPETPCR